MLYGNIPWMHPVVPFPPGQLFFQQLRPCWTQSPQILQNWSSHPLNSQSILLRRNVNNMAVTIFIIINANTLAGHTECAGHIFVLDVKQSNETNLKFYFKSKILWEFLWQYCEVVSWIYFKTTISIVVFYCMKFICFQNFGNNRETKSQKQASPKPILPHLHILVCPSTLTLWKLSSFITLKYNTDCSQSDFRSLMIGNIYSCHNISQVSATLGPQALSALISKFERRG